MSRRRISRAYIRRWYGIKSTKSIAARYGAQVQTIYSIVNNELEINSKKPRALGVIDDGKTRS